MFPGWTAEQLFGPCSDDQAKLIADIAPQQRPADSHSGPARLPPTLDVAAVFTNRSDFMASLSPQSLFDNAEDIRAAGLSLNLLCQHYPDQRLVRSIERGARLRCLFLDPNGAAIQAREHEEGHTPGHLSRLTELNIQVLRRIRDRLAEPVREQLSVAVYDETIRFNILLIDRDVCVMQPYLPETRGIDSPTFLIRQQDEHPPGLFAVFDEVFTSLWERGKLL